jgi:hypothetical protein
MDEVDACPHCGDPCFCDEACVRDMRRQEEANAAILRMAEARARRVHVVREDVFEMDRWVDDLLASFIDMQTKAYKEGSDA